MAYLILELDSIPRDRNALQHKINEALHQHRRARRKKLLQVAAVLLLAVVLWWQHAHVPTATLVRDSLGRVVPGQVVRADAYRWNGWSDVAVISGLVFVYSSGRLIVQARRRAPAPQVQPALEGV